MSTAGISFGGLASGLDTRAIIAALVAVERRPITALEQKKTGYSRQKSLFGDLGGLLDKLESAAKALKSTTDFLQMQATSNDESILTASASSSATPGTYTVRVNQLATAQINTAGRASPTAPIGGAAGPVSFQIDAGGVSLPISADPNLQSIAAAINAANTANDLGVRAEVIDTGNTTNPAERYELVLRSTQPGAANGFTISFDDGPPEFEQLIADLNANQRDAQDAELDVNGVTVFRSTNTISDLFAGITIDLRSADQTKDVTITVATDGAETAKKVKDLVDAYNSAVDFFTAQSALDANGKASSPLFGDPTLRSIRSSLRSIVGGSVATGNEAYQLLSQVGITADKDGKLTFNQSRFEEALADDEQAVTRLFTDSTNGITGRLRDQIDVYTDGVDGLLKTRNDGFDRLVKQTTDRIDQAERRLTLYQQQLEAKYANLETLLARLQGQGSSVGSIANLNFNR